ncbi:MAG: hypothetical protein HY962_01640 [Ignavibacteriae bacterium]|nr:hypothetical protein [Ignavibacteriota bacterium]
MAKQLIYSEFKFLILDYWRNLRPNEAIYEILIPLGLGFAGYLTVTRYMELTSILSLIGHILTLLSILVGFTVACVTILASTDGANIELLKKEPTDRKIGNRKMTLYQHLVMLFSFCLLEEIALLILSVSYYALYSSCSLNRGAGIGSAVIIAILLHILFLNGRNITNFYFVLVRD